MLANFEPLFYNLDRKSQLEVVHRFARRIDLGVTDIVIHWWFSAEVSTLPRTEVSPRRRKKGLSGRVVEIGAHARAPEHHSDECAKAVVDAFADALLRIRFHNH